MIDTVYIEKQIRQHPRVVNVLKSFPQARVIDCDRYGEVFNPKSQNFRLQKTNPALILAEKHAGFVLEAPEGYGIGGIHNYYFSHMLNCIYDCRYCFLQGMYRSAHYVLFVNYESFEQEIDNILHRHGQTPCWFFSGYDCDSLALEPVTGCIKHFLPFFSARPNAYLEIRTKSTQVRSLRNYPALPNVVLAYSFTPERISTALEHKVPSVKKRITIVEELQSLGWPIGLRFDPLIYCEDYQQQYQALFAEIFSRLDVAKLHSVSLGPFRLPKSFYTNIVKIYPEEALFAGPMEPQDNIISYQGNIEMEMMSFCEEQILKYISKEQFFPCVPMQSASGTVKQQATVD